MSQRANEESKNKGNNLSVPVPAAAGAALKPLEVLQSENVARSR